MITTVFEQLAEEKITENDRAILDGMTDTELADISNELNKWKWPDVLPGREVNEYVKNGRRSQLMGYIERKVGAELISRRWNKERMTDDEHKLFWESERNLLK